MAGNSGVSDVPVQPDPNEVPEDYPWEYDEEDDEALLGFTEADCGRWDNGRLTRSCTLAGSEDCDFECPLRGSLYK